MSATPIKNAVVIAIGKPIAGSRGISIHTTGSTARSTNPYNVTGILP